MVYSNGFGTPLDASGFWLLSVVGASPLPLPPAPRPSPIFSRNSGRSDIIGEGHSSTTF